MATPYVWTRDAMKVAAWIVARKIPPGIADRLHVSVYATGAVGLQVCLDVPVAERISHVDRIAGALGLVPSSEDVTSPAGDWWYRADGIVRGVRVQVYMRTHAAELGVPSVQDWAAA
jgi:hypothetical protein